MARLNDEVSCSTTPMNSYAAPRACLAEMLTRLSSAGGSEEAHLALGEAAYALLDDLGLTAYPGPAIGGLLHTAAEVDALRRLAAALDEVLGFVGACSLEERNMQHHGWAEVVASADAARSLFTALHD